MDSKENACSLNGILTLLILDMMKMRCEVRMIDDMVEKRDAIVDSESCWQPGKARLFVLGPLAVAK